MKRSQFPSDHIEVDGNRSGSYIKLARSEREGFCAIEVGETCVVTIREEIPVAWLAAILTKARDDGFENVLRAYGWDDGHIEAVRA